MISKPWSITKASNDIHRHLIHIHKEMLFGCVLLVAAGVLAGLFPGQAGERAYAAGFPAGSPVVADTASPSAAALDDGPHIFWHSDSMATVFYMCGGDIDSQTFDIRDTLRFRGLCSDSAVEYVIPAGEPAVEACVYENVSRILAVSDIQGEYDLFVDILVRAGMVDDDLRWAWGDGHLVINGDVFDRGEKVTECLWLIYRLEQEAKDKGGRVHFILGNHDLMAMRGDLRYVHKKYLDGIVKKSRIAYEDLYGPDMEMGRWLRARHTAVIINGILFVHGGISLDLIGKGYALDDLNRTVRRSLDLRSSQVAFSDEAKLLFKRRGPFWYRGYHYEMEGDYPQATAAEVDSILSFYGADAIVVGHTEVDQVAALYDGRVWAIDVPADELGALQALLWQGGRFYRVTGDGTAEPLE